MTNNIRPGSAASLHFKWRRQSTEWVLVADTRFRVRQILNHYQMEVPNRRSYETIPLTVGHLTNEDAKRRSTLNLSKYCLEFIYLDRITEKIAA